MKTIIAILLLTLTACASPKEKLSAQVLTITSGHDSYVGGGFKFYTIVTYRILNSKKTIQRYYDTDAPELKSLAVGEIVTLKE